MGAHRGGITSPCCGSHTSNVTPGSPSNTTPNPTGDGLHPPSPPCTTQRDATVSPCTHQPVCCVLEEVLSVGSVADIFPIGGQHHHGLHVAPGQVVILATWRAQRWVSSGYQVGSRHPPGGGRSSAPGSFRDPVCNEVQKCTRTHLQPLLWSGEARKQRHDPSRSDEGI